MSEIAQLQSLLDSTVNATDLNQLLHNFRVRWNLKPGTVVFDDHSEDHILDFAHHGTDPRFTYQQNAWGFRDDRTCHLTDIMTFGCSMAYGVGVPQSARFSDLVAEITGCSVSNYSVPAISASEIALLFTHVTRWIKPKIALIYLPSYDRSLLSTVESQSVQYFRASSSTDLSLLSPRQQQAHRSYYDQPISYRIDRFMTDLHSIYALAEARSIAVIVGSWSAATNLCLQSAAADQYRTQIEILPDLDRDCLGRDRQHPGVIYHRQLAEIISSKVDSIIKKP